MIKGGWYILDIGRAISIICEEELKSLSKEKRESILLSWWGIDDEDLEFSRLPETLQQEMIESDEPVADAVDTRYDPLLMEALKLEYIGVKNDYLSKRVSKILNKKIIVEGQPETLLACPCCQYRTLKERGLYYICPVCFWEDDGNDNSAKYSSPNHMTLAEGRDNFIKYGAVTESLVACVKSDGKERYYYSGNQK